jgi:hypothetical protein
MLKVVLATMTNAGRTALAPVTDRPMYLPITVSVAWMTSPGRTSKMPSDEERCTTHPPRLATKTSMAKECKTENFGFLTLVPKATMLFLHSPRQLSF